MRVHNCKQLVEPGIVCCNSPDRVVVPLPQEIDCREREPLADVAVAECPQGAGDVDVGGAFLGRTQECVDPSATRKPKVSFGCLNRPRGEPLRYFTVDVGSLVLRADHVIKAVDQLVLHVRQRENLPLFLATHETVERNGADHRYSSCRLLCVRQRCRLASRGNGLNRQECLMGIQSAHPSSRTAPPYLARWGAKPAQPSPPHPAPQPSPAQPSLAQSSPALACAQT